FFFFFSSRRRHTRSYGDWSSDVCSSDLDYFLAQRMFPRMALPQKVSDKMAASMAMFRQKNSTTSPDAVGTWTLAGPTNVGGRIKIGRASCREREENWEVAVETKTKVKKK